ncbi:MAG: type II toxin-antitoxin system Phd/YefM family antitoxin [Pseudomonadota bacterium]
MEKLNASDAQSSFSTVLMKVQQSPVSISENGKPVAVIVSAIEYEQIEFIKQRYLKAAIQEGMNDLATGNVYPGSIVFDELMQQV